MADSTPNISAAQIRAARGLLSWTQQHLADTAGVSRRTVASIELGEHDAYSASILALRTALEHAGVRFINDGEQEGVVIG